MKTLTITDAKKNLGRWLRAAVDGEQVGIVFGASIVALQPVEIQVKPWHATMPIDEEYIRKEYGVTPQQMEAAMERLNRRTEAELRAGKAIVIQNPTLEKLEKTIGDHPRAPRAARATAKNRARRRPVRAA